MSAKVYWLKFGSGDPRANTGLTPTFLQFYDSTGQTYAPPSISEVKYGGATASGVYGFSYLIGQSTLNSLYFLAYSVTAVSSGATNDQYITGVLDPVIAVDQQINAAGTTQIAFNASFIGSTASSFGTSGVDPSTVFGYLKRIQELLEGDQVFAASGGQWQIYNRASLGTTTLLRTKNVLNSGSSVTKTGI